jgi:hypothetical protein
MFRKPLKHCQTILIMNFPYFKNRAIHKARHEGGCIKFVEMLCYLGQTNPFVRNQLS